MLLNFITVERDNAPASKYRLLLQHLQSRFADRLVLTFAQIEDLLGFALPSQARSESNWWDTSTASGQRSDQSYAWTLAGRRASVNLAAQHVTFERDGTDDAEN